jgi:hypothetical protein
MFGLVEQPGSTLGFVRNCQAFTPLGAAPLENDSPILRRHPDEKPMRFGATAGIRLNCSRPLFRSRHAVLVSARSTGNPTE